MHTFTVRRLAETAYSTSGELLGEDGARLCRVLERGPHNPVHKRIPAGTYGIARKALWASHFDGAFSKLIGHAYKGILWLPDVPGRSNIEIHTANLVQQLEGCLALGEQLTKDDHNDFAILGGTSKPAYAHVYPIISAAIDDGGAQLVIEDVPAVAVA